MAKLRILQFPRDDKRLRQQGKHVENVADSRIQKIIDDMFETHYSTANCAALAATQLDIDNPPMITVIDFSTEKNQPLCLVNPDIYERTGDFTQEEGCMSVGGGTYEKITRAESIKVRALDRHGKTLDFAADGFMAKCIQHEVDHLHGKLFIDYLSRLKRQRIQKKIIKLDRWEQPETS